KTCLMPRENLRTGVSGRPVKAIPRLQSDGESSLFPMAIEGAIIGVDEVGRGCLAGPVYAAAVMFRSRKVLKFIDDSKLLSEPERRRLAPLIHSHHYVGIGIASVAEIEEYNILQASFIAMRRAIQTVRLVSGVEPEHVLVDGH